MKKIKGRMDEQIGKMDDSDDLGRLGWMKS